MLAAETSPARRDDEVFGVALRKGDVGIEVADEALGFSGVIEHGTFVHRRKSYSVVVSRGEQVLRRFAQNGSFVLFDVVVGGFAGD